MFLIIVGHDTTVHVPTNVCSLYLRCSTMYSSDCKVASSYLAPYFNHRLQGVMGLHVDC